MLMIEALHVIVYQPHVSSYTICVDPHCRATMLHLGRIGICYVWLLLMEMGAYDVWFILDGEPT